MYDILYMDDLYEIYDILIIWVNYHISLTWIVKGHLGIISLTNHYSQWGRGEVVIIYPDIMYYGNVWCVMEIYYMIYIYIWTHMTYMIIYDQEEFRQDMYGNLCDIIISCYIISGDNGVNTWGPW